MEQQPVASPAPERSGTRSTDEASSLDEAPSTSAAKNLAFPAAVMEPISTKDAERVNEVISKHLATAASARLKCQACRQKGEGPDVKLRTCRACGVARYCNRDCQQEDWPAHKQICGIFAADGVAQVRHEHTQDL